MSNANSAAIALHNANSAGIALSHADSAGITNSANSEEIAFSNANSMGIAANHADAAACVHAAAAPANAPPGALVLCAQIAALQLLRRLGRAGIAAGCADACPSVAMQSRYCREAILLPPAPDTWLVLLRATRRLGPRPVLLATSDETLLWMSRHRQPLAEDFRFLLPSGELLENFVDKRSLYELANQHGISTPRSVMIHDAAGLERAAAQLGYPCLLKSAYSKPGGRDPALGKLLARNPHELAAAYARVEVFDRRLLLQEYIPGDCRQVLMYNAFFNAAAEPVAVFTGRKLRQYPPDFGTASLSEALPLPGLAMRMTEFFQRLGFCGPVDCGLKFDPRSGETKLLDVNPRLGQNYRAWIGRDGVDLGWLAYRAAAGERWPANFSPLAAMRPRRWLIEDNDWRSRRQMRAAGAPRELTSFAAYAGVRELAYLCWRDPAPAWHRLRALWRSQWAGDYARDETGNAKSSSWATRSS